MHFPRMFLPVLALTLVSGGSAVAATKKKPARPSQAPAKPVSRSRPHRSGGSAAVAATTTAAGASLAGREGAEGGVDVVARGAFLLDALSGKPLFEKNADTRFYPASTTKIMTALLVIESGNLEETVEITEEDARVGESSLSVRPGQTFTRRQMLYGLLLKSANDVAHALGRDNGGSVPLFAEKMTQRARELGCTNTLFANPHGLHSPNHYTTPRDLALITKAAMNQPLFRQIVATKRAPWESVSGTLILNNHNRLLERFPGCNGVKTGYTIPAQQVLASSASRGGCEAIAVVMHTDKPGIWEDSSKLLEFGLKHVAPLFSMNP